MLLFCLLFHLLRPTLSFSPGQIRFGKVLTRVTRAKTVSDPRFQDLSDTRKIHNTAHNFLKLNPLRPTNELKKLKNEYNISDDIGRVGRSAFFDKLTAEASLEHSPRKIMHVKMDFHTRYTNPIVPQYNDFLSNLMAAVFTQSHDPVYAYDALQAFGICTQYYSVMQGYECQDQVEPIFDTMMNALGMDPKAIKIDAKQVLQQVDITRSLSDEDFLNSADSEVGKIFDKVRSNRHYHYTDAWGVGLVRLMELRKHTPPTANNFITWSDLLVNVPVKRLSSSWSAFCTAQSIVRNADLLQKELLEREREQLATRLAKAKAKAKDTFCKIDNFQHGINAVVGEGREHMHVSMIRCRESAR